MKSDDPKKPLPRPEWSDEDERRREKERVSRLLDAESASPAAAAPEDPEQGEVYGRPPDETDPAPVYGMPEDELPPRMTVYGGPTIGRSGPRYGLFIAIAAIALGAPALWWFLH